MSLYGAKSPPAGEHSDADGMDCQIRKYIRIGNNYVLPVEEALIESGLEFTILNPAMFFQNIATGGRRRSRPESTKRLGPPAAGSAAWTSET